MVLEELVSRIKDYPWYVPEPECDGECPEMQWWQALILLALILSPLIPIFWPSKESKSSNNNKHLNSKYRLPFNKKPYHERYVKKPFNYYRKY